MICCQLIRRCALSLVFMLASVWVVQGQTNIDSVSSSESRCLKSGSLIIHISGTQGPVQYALISPSSELRALQNSDSFFALVPGNYTVRVVDSLGNSDTLTASVSGTYSVPTYTVQTTSVYCHDSNGSARVINDQGRDPFRYRIISGPKTTGWRYNGFFDSLALGTYLIETEDSCSTITQLSATVRDSVISPLSLRADIIDQIGCDSIKVRTLSVNGIGPLEVLAISAVDTQTETTQGAFAEFELSSHQQYTLKVVDQCGDSSMFVVDTSDDRLPIEVLSFFCGGFKGRALPIKNGLILNNSTCLHFGLLNLDDQTEQWNDDGYFDFEHDVNYQVVMADTCCRDTFSTSFQREDPGGVMLAGFDRSNLGNTAGLWFRLDGIGIGAALILAGSPYSKGDTFNTVDHHGRQQQYIVPFDLWDTILTFDSYYKGMANFPPGDYSFVAIDSCGNTDTVLITIDSADLTYFNQTVDPILGCPYQNAIGYCISSNYFIHPNSYYTTITDTSGVSYTFNYLWENTPGVHCDTLFSLREGEYVVKTHFLAQDVFLGPTNHELIDTVLLEDALQPFYTEVLALGCHSDSIQVFGRATEGVPPLQYRIKPDTATLWGQYQDTAIWRWLRSGLYNLEVQDVCGNSTVSNIHTDYLRSFTLVPLLRCEADSIWLSVQPYLGVNFTWIKDQIVVAQDTVLSFSPLNLSDTGRYHVQATLESSCDVAEAYIRVTPDGIELLDSLSGCDSIFDGDDWINQSGIQRDTLSTENQCGVIRSTNVQLQYSTFVSEALHACDSLWFDNIWVRDSMVLWDTVYSSFSCPQISESIIAISKTKYMDLTVQACDSFVSPLGDAVTGSGSVNDTFSVGLCDSIVRYDVSINPSYFKSVDTCACVVFVVPNSGEIMRSSGVFLDTVITNVGCDSVIRWNVSINETVNTTMAENHCGQFRFRGLLLNQSGIYFDTMQSSSGCDSIIELDLEIVEDPANIFLYIPNAVTPNDDGTNDYFPFTEPVEVTSYWLRIYNRWGQKVFDSALDNKQNWGGVFEGEFVQNDVYVYLIQYDDCNGGRKFHKGEIHVMR